MTYNWTPHESDRDAVHCKTGIPNVKAGIVKIYNGYMAIIILTAFRPKWMHMKKLWPTKEQAMTAVEEELSNLAIMTQPLRTWYAIGLYKVYRTKKHIAHLKLAQGKHNVTVLIRDKHPLYSFCNSFDTEAEAKTWVEQLS